MFNLKTIVAGAAALAVVLVGAFAAWFFFIRDDGPAAVSTDSALESLENRTPAATSPASSGGAATATPSSPGSNSSTSGGIEGQWVVDTSLGSFVGYRVQEELVGIGGTTAVGRTSGLTGGFTVSGANVSSASIVADMTKLKSQESLRDGQLRNQGIEYAKFPTSEFKLDATTLPADVAAGKTAAVDLKGTLTLHGVTKAITMPAEVTLKDGVLVVVGQVPIVFADYSITKPSAARVASIEDNGIMEVQLFFKKS